MNGTSISASHTTAPGTRNQARNKASGTAMSDENTATAMPSPTVFSASRSKAGSDRVGANAENGAASEPRPSSGKMACRMTKVKGTTTTKTSPAAATHMAGEVPPDRNPLRAFLDPGRSGDEKAIAPPSSADRATSIVPIALT